jgi:heme-degrading monooxygenase HmoA
MVRGAALKLCPKPGKSFERKERPMSESPNAHARYVRIWRGRTRSADADAYESYWLANGIGPLKARGALAVHMLRDDRKDETEFVTISYWASLDAMTGGKGGDPRLTHHLDRDPEFLLELPRTVELLSLLRSE